MTINGGGAMATKGLAVTENEGIRPEGRGSLNALRRFVSAMGKISEGATATLVWMDPNALHVDPGLQRPLKLHALQFLIKFWNVALCSPLTASTRANGRIVVICGQHRWKAALAAGEALIPVLVWTGLSREDESKIFLAEDHRVRISPYDRLKLRQSAGDEHAARMTDIVVGAGYAFSPKTTHPEPNKIPAIGAIESVYRMDDGKTLKDTLSVLRDAFGSDTNQIHGGMITGVGKIVRAYGDAVDRQVLARVLEKAGVLGVKSQALLVASQGQGRGWLAWSLSMLGLYNSVRGPSRRLMADVLRSGDSQ